VFIVSLCVPDPHATTLPEVLIATHPLTQGMRVATSAVRSAETVAASEPSLFFPQATMPSPAFHAANVPAFESTRDTPEVNKWFTEFESPPHCFLPHVTTDPSLFSAANALSLDVISVTFSDKISWTLEMSAPSLFRPQATTPPVLINMAAKADLVARIHRTPDDSASMTALESPP